MLQYMNNNNIKNCSYTINCNFNSNIDFDIEMLKNIFPDNILIKTDSKHHYFNYVNIYIKYPTNIHFRICNHTNTIRAFGVRSMTDFYHSVNILTNVLKTKINDLEYINNSVKVSFITATTNFGFDSKNNSEAYFDLIKNEFKCEICSHTNKYIVIEQKTTNQKTKIRCIVFLSGKALFTTTNYTHIHLLHSRLKKILINIL
jgi:hypothetical protein